MNVIEKNKSTDYYGSDTGGGTWSGTHIVAGRHIAVKKITVATDHSKHYLERLILEFSDGTVQSHNPTRGIDEQSIEFEPLEVIRKITVYCSTSKHWISAVKFDTDKQTTTIGGTTRSKPNTYEITFDDGAILTGWWGRVGSAINGVKFNYNLPLKDYTITSINYQGSQDEPEEPGSTSPSTLINCDKENVSSNMETSVSVSQSNTHA